MRYIIILGSGNHLTKVADTHAASIIIKVKMWLSRELFYFIFGLIFLSFSTREGRPGARQGIRSTQPRSNIYIDRYSLPSYSCTARIMSVLLFSLSAGFFLILDGTQLVTQGIYKLIESWVAQLLFWSLLAFCLFFSCPFAFRVRFVQLFCIFRRMGKRNFARRCVSIMACCGDKPSIGAHHQYPAAHPHHTI